MWYAIISARWRAPFHLCMCEVRYFHCSCCGVGYKRWTLLSRYPIQYRAMAEFGPVMDRLNSFEVARSAHRSAKEHSCRTWSCSSVGNSRKRFTRTSSVCVGGGAVRSLRLLRKGSGIVFNAEMLDFRRCLSVTSGLAGAADEDNVVLVRDNAWMAGTGLEGGGLYARKTAPDMVASILKLKKERRRKLIDLGLDQTM